MAKSRETPILKFWSWQIRELSPLLRPAFLERCTMSELVQTRCRMVSSFIIAVLRFFLLLFFPFFFHRKAPRFSTANTDFYGTISSVFKKHKIKVSYPSDHHPFPIIEMLLKVVKIEAKILMKLGFVFSYLLVKKFLRMFW